MRQKLRGQSGETLTETLVGILIVALSSLLFVTMLGVSVRMLNTAAETDQALYEALSTAETSQGTESIDLVFSSQSGNEIDKATAYKSTSSKGNVSLTYYTHKEATGS